MAGSGPHLTFIIEAGRVVVVEGRQLASEHNPRFSLGSPGLRPGEERREVRPAQAPATRREGGQAPGRSEMTAASTNRGLGMTAALEFSPIAALAGEVGPRRGTSTLK